MRLGTMIGDVAERIPLLRRVVRWFRVRCRKKKRSRPAQPRRHRFLDVVFKKQRHCPMTNATTQRDAYRTWVRRHDTPTAAELKRLRESTVGFTATPLISVVMPVFNTPPQVLEEAIRSVREQVYDRWELCIADDGSTLPHVRAILTRHAAADPRIKVRFCPPGGNIPATSNAALELATGEYDGAQDHDLALRVVAAVPATRIVHIPRILSHWRAVPDSAAVSIDEKPAAVSSGQRAVAAHLKQIGRCGVVEPAPVAPGFYRVRYSLPATPPPVSIVICTRDQGRLIRTAVDSIMTRSTYENFEIMIVDNGSREVETVATLAELAV